MPRPPTDPDGLTRRQRQICALVPECLTYAEIGQRLGIAPGTVNNHMQAIRRKTGTTCQASLAVWVMRQQANEPIRCIRVRLRAMPHHYCRGKLYVPLGRVMALLDEAAREELAITSREGGCWP